MTSLSAEMEAAAAQAEAAAAAAQGEAAAQLAAAVAEREAALAEAAAHLSAAQVLIASVISQQATYALEPPPAPCCRAELFHGRDTATR